MSLERIVAYLRRAEEGVVDEVRGLGHATALLTPSLPLVWSLNALRVDDPGAGVDELVAAADEALGHLSHRKLIVYDQALGARLAPELASNGWNVYRLLVMVRDRAPERTVAAGHRRRGRPRSGRRRAGGVPARAAVRLAGGGGEAAHRHGRALRAGGGAPRLRRAARRSRRRVPPLHRRRARPDRRGRHDRGRARARLRERRGPGRGQSAEAKGCDPIFLLTDAADWPQQLYARLGFAPIGEVYDFLKLPLATARP